MGQKQLAPQMGQKQLAPQMGQKPQASLVRQPQASLDARHLASLKEKNKTSAATSKLSEDQSQTKTTPEKKHLSGQEEEEQLVFNSSQTTVFQRALEPVTLRSAGSDQDTLRRNGHSCSKPFGFGETVRFRTHTMGSNISQEKISRQKKDRIAARKEATEKFEDAQQTLVPVQREREKEKEKEKETGPNDVQLPKHPGEDEADCIVRSL
ncbi:hypothetical protein DUI87_17681 [Hirundo rustica rustica]|uniref:Uncharacterized protein n=1 Tax=Hirundo rustica rustica TaxID=333673 RepID=A0A3M0JX85_HIRRU|nr:hypothetical protein DUI87_17681 [Hirundo rustica rustica]